MFLVHSDIDIVDFADENASYLSAKNVKDVTESLERASVYGLRSIDCEKRLGVKFDSKLNILQICIEEIAEKCTN